jgi:hypothetical protein
VEGTITLGTAGSVLPGDLDVQVAIFTMDDVGSTLHGSVNDGGRFRVEGVPRQDGAAYLVALDFSGTTYGNRIDPPTEGDTVTTDITVYETVNTDPGLRFDQSAIVLSSIDQNNQVLSVLEFHRIVNPTDRTFAPQADGPGGPSGLLVFGLPPGAFDLQVEFGLDASRLIQIDRGVASLAPIVPGATEIGFTYRVPYDATNALFQRTIRYPVSKFLVFSPFPGPGLQSDQLGGKTTSDVSGRQYLTMSGGPFTPGTPVGVTFSDLPVRGGPFASIPPVAIAGGGLIIGLAVVAFAFGRRRAALATPALAAVRTGPADDIVERIVALDLAHDRGDVDDKAYETQRAALLREAAQTASSSPEHAADSEALLS